MYIWTMKEVFFPYGVSNFEEIVRENFVFVDKTHYIERLEKDKEKRISFLRPRRFGKSLFLSVLEYYYDINQKHKLEELFGRYYIGKNPTSLANSYRILKFDFSGIDTSDRESAKQGFNLSVKTSLKQFANFNPIFSQTVLNEILHSGNAEEMLTYFFKEYPKDIPIYVLIDEYDHFTNEILYRDIEGFKDSVSKQGYVRKFYEVIKTATQQGIVDRIFITGVSPVTLDSLTSGFNILSDLTHHPQYETMMGFTEDEVKTLLDLVLQDKNRKETILQELRIWYNGYRFYEGSTLNIYNSDMVLYYLKHFKDTQQAPKTMLDLNIAPDYGKLKQMFRVVNLHKNLEVLREVLEKGYVSTELIGQFNFEEDFGEREFINFLAYLGNLTIHKSVTLNVVQFKIPNRVIADLYWQYYAEVLQERADLEYNNDEVLDAVLEMALQGKYEDFFILIEKLLKNLSNRDFMRFDEKYVKMAVMAYLIQANIFFVISEQETQGGGYPDLFLFKKPNNPQEHHEFVIELKYLKKEEENKLQEKQEEGKQQLIEYYQKDKVLQSKSLLHLLVVVVIKDEVKVEEILF